MPARGGPAAPARSAILCCRMASTGRNRASSGVLRPSEQESRGGFFRRVKSQNGSFFGRGAARRSTGSPAPPSPFGDDTDDEGEREAMREAAQRDLDGGARGDYYDPVENFIYLTDDGECEGWLDRRSQLRREWRQRYAIVKGTSLFVARSERSTPIARIDLTRCTAVDARPSNGTYELLVDCTPAGADSAVGADVYFFRVVTADEKDRWESAIRHAMAMTRGGGAVLCGASIPDDEQEPPFLTRSGGLLLRGWLKKQHYGAELKPSEWRLRFAYLTPQRFIFAEGRRLESDAVNGEFRLTSHHEVFTSQDAPLMLKIGSGNDEEAPPLYLQTVSYADKMAWTTAVAKQLRILKAEAAESHDVMQRRSEDHKLALQEMRRSLRIQREDKATAGGPQARHLRGDSADLDAVLEEGGLLSLRDALRRADIHTADDLGAADVDAALPRVRKAQRAQLKALQVRMRQSLSIVGETKIFADDAGGFKYLVEPAARQGWLHRQSTQRRGDGWKRRYFLLRGTRLFYARSSYANPHGALSLGDVRTLEDEDGEIVMTLNAGGSAFGGASRPTIALRADSREAHMSWSLAIRAARDAALRGGAVWSSEEPLEPLPGFLRGMELKRHGYLKKQSIKSSGVFANWKLRYFYLADSRLVYCEDFGDDRSLVKGEYKITAQHEVFTSPERPTTIKVSTADGETPPLYLESESPADIRAWLDSIAEVVTDLAQARRQQDIRRAGMYSSAPKGQRGFLARSRERSMQRTSAGRRSHDGTAPLYHPAKQGAPPPPRPPPRPPQPAPPPAARRPHSGHWDRPPPAMPRAASQRPPSGRWERPAPAPARAPRRPQAPPPPAAERPPQPPPPSRPRATSAPHRPPHRPRGRRRRRGGRRGRRRRRSGRRRARRGDSSARRCRRARGRRPSCRTRTKGGTGGGARGRRRAFRRRARRVGASGLRGFGSPGQGFGRHGRKRGTVHPCCVFPSPLVAAPPPSAPILPAGGRDPLHHALEEPLEDLRHIQAALRAHVEVGAAVLLRPGARLVLGDGPPPVALVAAQRDRDLPHAETARLLKPVVQLVEARPRPDVEDKDRALRVAVELVADFEHLRVAAEVEEVHLDLPLADARRLDAVVHADGRDVLLHEAALAEALDHAALAAPERAHAEDLDPRHRRRLGGHALAVVGAGGRPPPPLPRHGSLAHGVIEKPRPLPPGARSLGRFGRFGRSAARPLGRWAALRFRPFRRSPVPPVPPSFPCSACGPANKLNSLSRRCTGGLEPKVRAGANLARSALRRTVPLVRRQYM